MCLGRHQRNGRTLVGIKRGVVWGPLVSEIEDEKFVT